MSSVGSAWYQSTVNRIETGGRTVTWDEAVALSTLLDFDLTEAAGEDLDLVLAQYRRQRAEFEALWQRSVERVIELCREYGPISAREVNQLMAGEITPEELKEKKRARKH
jgi:hypothetical protein